MANNIGQINFTNLNDIASFKDWIHNNIDINFEDDKIPNHVMLIYLDYISKQIKEQDEDCLLWSKIIRKLESDIKSLNRAEQNEF